MVEKFTDDNFEEKVLKSDVPVLVDFYADWCGPCRMMAPAVEEMSEKYAGRLTVGKINVDENMQTAMAFRVSSIPYIVLIKNGQVENAMLGAGPKSQLEGMITKAL